MIPQYMHPNDTSTLFIPLPESATRAMGTNCHCSGCRLARRKGQVHSRLDWLWWDGMRVLRTHVGDLREFARVGTATEGEVAQLAAEIADVDGEQLAAEIAARVELKEKRRALIRARHVLQKR